MRLPEKSSVPTWRASVWLCAVFLLVAVPVLAYLLLMPSAVMAERQYRPGLAITPVTIETPTGNAVWLAGSAHTVTCSGGVDIDEYCDTEDITETWYPINDAVTHYWEGSGKFKHNDNIGSIGIGTSVTYICTDTAGTNNITVTAKDEYVNPALNINNPALAKDAVEPTASKTVAVIIPAVDTIKYGGSGNHAIADVTADPEYNRASGRNEPAAYTMWTQNTTATVTCSATTKLTESSGVEVQGDTGNASMEVTWFRTSGTFGTTWPSTIKIVGDNWSLFVQKITYTATWQYRCPSGSNNWIDMTIQANHVIYAVRKKPVSVQPKACYEYSVRYCEGLRGNSTDNDVCERVMTGFSKDYKYDADSGNCAYMSSDYTHLIGIQGTTAKQERWGVSTNRPPKNGQVLRMNTHPIKTLGNPVDTFGWGFHWWVYAGGKTRDPSAGVSKDMTWGDYEDELFDTYRRLIDGVRVDFPNPPGQATETSWWGLTRWRMDHDDKRKPIRSAFVGPPTPW